MEERLETEIRTTLIDKLSDFIRIDNTSRNFDAEWETNGKLARATAFCRDWLVSLRLQNAEFEIVSESGVTPLLFGQVRTPNAEGTVMFYGHIDKQPPFDGWGEGLGAYEPVLRGGRLYGRGGVDDGYSVFLAGLLTSTLQRAGRLRNNVVFFFETDEESGSRDIDHHLERLSPLFPSPNLILVCDSGGPDHETLYLTESLRGIASFTARFETRTTERTALAVAGAAPDPFRAFRRFMKEFEHDLPEIVWNGSRPVDAATTYANAVQFIAEKGSAVAASLPLLDGVKHCGCSLFDAHLANTQGHSLTCIALEGLPDAARGTAALSSEIRAKLSVRLPPAVDARAVRRNIEVWAAEWRAPRGVTLSLEKFGCARGAALTNGLSPVKAMLDEVAPRLFGRKCLVSGVGGSIGAVCSFAQRFPESAILVSGCVSPDARIHVADENLNVEYLVKFAKAILYLLDNA